MNNKTDYLLPDLSKWDTNIENETKFYNKIPTFYKKNFLRKMILKLMEIQASILDKIPKTTLDSFKSILHPKPSNNISISREND